MIEITNKFGSNPEVELNEFEKVNNIKLPGDYRDFLLEYNGGKPNPNEIDSPPTLVTFILGMHNGDYYASLYKHIDMFSTRLPLTTFPIATDPFGNLFIMSVNSNSFGQIYFWDHEGEPEHQDGHYIANCTFVAYSFTDFLGMLK